MQLSSIEGWIQGLNSERYSHTKVEALHIVMKDGNAITLNSRMRPPSE